MGNERLAETGAGKMSGAAEERKYFLAVDIGASSGRHMLGHLEAGRLCLEEIYRFPNGLTEKNGHLCWDLEGLFEHILEGLRRCRQLSKQPLYMGIDTWGVDFVLLDGCDRVLGDTVAYRDYRTEGMPEQVYKRIGEEQLYARTGIQKAVFNTIYQLAAIQAQEPELLSRAESLLMIPDYFHFLLTGRKAQEYTNASTTQLLNAEEKCWDKELLQLLGLPERLFGRLVQPAHRLGRLRPELAASLGFDVEVIVPATHDTASAVMSVPSQAEDTLYISSGTWSLMGCELSRPLCTEAARAANFTNEGGYAYRYRFLKNIMGLWMIQSVRRELEAGYAFPGRGTDDDYSYARLCARAEQEPISSLVDANDGRFLAPQSMIAEIQAACRESGQEVPQTAWELAAVIYNSLAHCYKKTAEQIEALTGRHFDAIHIVGGGSQADYLNRLTARLSGRTVFAGPAEATAIGNIGAQLLADGAVSSLADFRGLIYSSFGVACFKAESM